MKKIGQNVVSKRQNVVSKCKNVVSKTGNVVSKKIKKAYFMGFLKNVVSKMPVF